MRCIAYQVFLRDLSQGKDCKYREAAAVCLFTLQLDWYCDTMASQSRNYNSALFGEVVKDTLSYSRITSKFFEHAYYGFQVCQGNLPGQRSHMEG